MAKQKKRQNKTKQTNKQKNKAKSIQHIHKRIEERGARWCQMSEEEFCLIQVQLFDPSFKKQRST